MKKHLLALVATTAFVASVPIVASAQTGDTLAKVKASGTIALGVRDTSGVLSYTLGSGKYAGYHVDVCQHIVVNTEKAIGRKLSVKYIPVNSQNRIELVQAGTVDLECGSTSNTAARQKDVAFALTTYVEEVRLAVRANSGIASIKNLGGKTVATTRGTTSVQTLRKQARADGVAFNEAFGNDHADSFQLLETGRADAFLMDGQILASHIANAKNPSEFNIVGEVLSVEPIAIMFRKDDVAFKKLADDSIRELQQSGELAKIYDKWFMQPIPPKNTRVGLPASEATKAAWAHLNDKPMEDYAKK
ncbi:MAG: amino acid ABC transporter substrate-binding protein [Pseudomonadota bacterium]